MGAKVLEKDVLADCKSILSICQSRSILVYNRIHVMPIWRAGRVASQNLDMKGLEDLMIFLQGGLTLHVECKGTQGTLSPEQIERRTKLQKIGHVYEVVRSGQQLLDLLIKHEPRVKTLFAGMEIHDKESIPRPKPLKPVMEYQ